MEHYSRKMSDKKQLSAIIEQKREFCKSLIFAMEKIEKYNPEIKSKGFDHKYIQEILIRQDILKSKDQI